MHVAKPQQGIKIITKIKYRVAYVQYVGPHELILFVTLYSKVPHLELEHV